MSEQPTSARDWALLYGGLGWRVFPVVPGGKRPLYRGWQRDGTTDPELIGRYWRADPTPNVGITCGENPGKADELAEAQRLGGVRRKRERTIAAAYDFTGLGSIDAIRRILEVATTDVLSLENSIARVRALISAALGAAKLLETGELEARLAVLELALGSARDNHASDPSDGGLLGG